ncbi:MAG: BtrH N-terminal domain-containing protein [Candidatus Thorarchaeota archaeon]
MKSSSVVVLAFVLLLVIPISAQGATTPQPTFIPSADALLEPQEYVWQEINGFCAWAATAMAMQYAGVELDLYDVFAASTIGFSFAYFRFDETLLLFPGALLTQVEPTHFLANLYGVNYTQYFGDNIPDLEQTVQVYSSQGINTGVLEGEADAVDFMRSTIDSGYPILMSVDPVFLPASDYDILRDESLSGGGHGILVVGYNDSAQTATIIDPGVGSFGDDFGYPDDGRGNYSTISYTLLLDAWSSRYYIASTFLPLTTPSTSVDSQIGPMVRDKLLGTGTSYFPTSANAYVGQFGHAGFRGLSTDLTSDGLKTYLSIFDDIEDEVNFKAALLYFIGLGLEAQVTLQYLSFRTALYALPSLMPDTDLTEFVTAGEVALPAFDGLADNTTLIYPGNLSVANGFIVSTFRGIADAYNASGDLDASMIPFESDLETITGNLLTIADSWQAAGMVLDGIWPSGFLQVYGPILAFAGAGVGALVIIAFWWIKKKPSQ